MMDPAKKLAFVHNMTKLGLAHYDAGGTVAPQSLVSGPSQASVQGAANNVALPNKSLPALVNPVQSAGNAVNLFGQGAQGVGSALTAQNQYQAGLAPTTQTNYQPVIGTASNNALSGFQTEQDLQAQQQGLANQLQNQTLGGGPNPAQAALAQNTGQNVANQAALAAGQRGASSNVGLIQREAAQQGAATQQNAVGQAATLQAQQQLAAEQALQQQQGLQSQANLGEQGVNANLFGTAATAQNAQNAGQIQNYNNEQSINAGIAQNNANAVNKTTSGLIGGGASALAALAAEGGEIEHYDGGGFAAHNTPSVFTANGEGVSIPNPMDAFKSLMPSGNSSQTTSQAGTILAGGNSDVGGVSDLSSGAMFAAKGGAIKSRAGQYLDASGGKVNAENKKEKAVKKDNSYSNDKVPALLSEGEIVIPRSITQHPMAPEKAAEFVRMTLAKHGMPMRMKKA